MRPRFLHPALRRACVAALLLFGLSGAATAALFAGAGNDLYSEMKSAEREGRRLAVYFELPDCPGCREMKKHVFSDARAEREFGRQYRTVRLDLLATEPVVDVSGKRVSVQALAQRLHIGGTPAFAFFSGKGAFDYSHVGSIPDPVDFIGLGRFVAESAYENQPYAEYRHRYGNALYAEADPAAAQPLDFELRDHTGRLRHLADFRGESVALAVGYMYCPDVCPTTLLELKTAVEALGADASHVQVLFATLDPERDSARALAAYVTGFHRDFLGLRGSAAQTAAFVRRFALIAEKQPSPVKGHYSLDHTAGVFLFDHNGQLRGFSPYGQPLDLLTADLKKLARGAGMPPALLSKR